MDNLLNQKIDIENKMKGHKPQSRLNNREQLNSRNRSLQHAASNILNSSSSSISNDNIRQTQERIDKLIKDRQKTLQTLNDSDTEKDMFEAINVDFNPQFYEKAKDYTKQLRNAQNVDPKDKARHLNNILQKVSDPYGFDPNKKEPIYAKVKPIMDK